MPHFQYFLQSGVIMGFDTNCWNGKWSAVCHFNAKFSHVLPASRYLRWRTSFDDLGNPHVDHDRENIRQSFCMEHMVAYFPRQLPPNSSLPISMCHYTPTGRVCYSLAFKSKLILLAWLCNTMNCHLDLLEINFLAVRKPRRSGWIAPK